MKIVFCDDFTCKHNDSGNSCLKDEIHIEMECGEMLQGKPICYNTCKDYEVKKNGIHG